MTDQAVIDIGISAAMIAMKVAAPALCAILVSGLIVSILQAATQVNEQTLSFIPKIIAMTAALFISAPWILATMTNFAEMVFKSIENVAR